MCAPGKSRRTTCRCGSSSIWRPREQRVSGSENVRCLFRAARAAIRALVAGGLGSMAPESTDAIDVERHALPQANPAYERSPGRDLIPFDGWDLIRGPLPTADSQHAGP